MFAQISGYFVTNKKLSTLAFIALLFGGVLAFILTPKKYNPDIVAPAFRLEVQAPGMTAGEVYELVTKPLENVLNEIPGVEDIYSRSIHGGLSLVTVRFYVGEDMEKSMIRLHQRISSNLDLKPIGVNAPSIVMIDPEDLPVMTVALISDKFSPAELRKRAFMLKDELKTAPGISIIEVVGGQKREFQILLDPEKMRESKTDVNEISEALRRTSVLRSLGPLKTPEVYYPVELSSTVNSVAEIKNLVITSNVAVDLTASDVGKIRETHEEQTGHANLYLDGRVIRDAVFLSLAKKKNTNIVPVTKDIRKRLETLGKEAPFLRDVTTVVLRDEGQVAYEEIRGLTVNLVQAVAIVFAVLFLFLNARAALIVALSVPLTLLTVFALGFLAGYTINRITLFALILSLGLLVDAATVVIENIVRLKQLKPAEPPEQIIATAVGEVGPGLFLSTLTTVLAFIPMAFVTGMMGPYMGPIPFFVPAALIVSLVFACTLNPWLASSVCRKTAVNTGSPRIPFLASFQSRFMEGYIRFMDGVLSRPRRRLALIAAGAVLILAISSFPVIGWVKFRMLPKADRNQIYIYLDLARGSSLERTDQIAGDLALFLKRQKTIESVQSFAGMPPILDFNGMFKDAALRDQSHQATLRLNLTHHSRRRDKSEQLALAYRPLIADFLKPYDDARFQVIEDPPGPPVPSTFLLKVKGRNKALLEEIARSLEKKLKDVRGVEDLDTSILEPLDNYLISVDRRQAAAAKVSTSRIAGVLTTLYQGAQIGVYHNDHNFEQEYIVLKFPRGLRDDIGDLAKIYMTNELGNEIPVSKFLSVRKGLAEDVILADNRLQVVYISGEMGARSVTDAAIDTLKMLFAYRLPDGKARLEKFSPFGASYRTEGGLEAAVEFGGEWELTLEVFRDLGMAMAVAVFLIYCVMVIQFRSYRIPLLILGTIPLSLVGVLPGFALLHQTHQVYFSATSMIGVIALSGIVVNNAIILMEYVLQIERETKMPLKDALLEACKARMRPILLTSLTTVLGTLMIAADPVWAGLAWSVVFGLSLSAILTLVFFPTLVCHFGRS